MYKKVKKLYPAAKTILLFAGVGAFVAATLVMPGLPRILKGKDLDKLFENFLAEEEWEEFDERRLRQRLKEMRKQKLIRIYKIDEKYAVQITNKGKKRLLKYKLEELTIPKPDRWDGRWRLVTYDVPKTKNNARDAIRKTLKKLGFLQLQKSVYLYPYPCEDAIDFLRELYGIGENVTLLTVGYLENEEVYKEYFSL